MKRILVTNDDGITAKGIASLVEALEGIGELVIIAPDKPQSGQGHAITLNDPLRLRRSTLFQKHEAYEASGTPADCVKLGKHLIFKGSAPDIVVSGINHGSNSAISVLYSGTMSAAMEAAIEGIPAIGFSLLDHHPNADFSHTYPFIQEIVKKVLEEGLPHQIALNVNFPDANTGIKGFKAARQADARYLENFDHRKDPYGRPYYWLDGTFKNFDDGQDTDEWALAQGYASVVPCSCDRTSYQTLTKITNWF